MRRKVFLDLTGQLREVHCLSPIDLERFLDYLELATTTAMRANLDIESAYLQNDLVRQLCDRCLKLHGIKPRWCDMALIIRLLFQPGELVRLNDRPRSDVADGPTVTTAEWVAGIIAALIEVEGMQRAIEIAETVPADLLADVFQARLEQMSDPEKPGDPPLTSPEYQRLIELSDSGLMGIPL